MLIHRDRSQMTRGDMSLAIDELLAEVEKLRAERDEALVQRVGGGDDYRIAAVNEARERMHAAEERAERAEGLARELEGPARDAVALLRLVAPHSGVIGDLDGALARYDEAQKETAWR